MRHHNNYMSPFSLLLFMFVLAGFILAADNAWSLKIKGPFVPGTGYWDTIKYGDAEAGTTIGWHLNVPGYTESFEATSEESAAGSYSYKLVSKQMNTGWGIAAVYNSSITLTPGTYVLSGFILAPEVSSKHNYLDLNDWNSEPKNMVVVGGESQDWWFVYGEFTVSGSKVSVTPRMVRDSYLPANSYAYFDEIAITPKDKFRAPTPVPEPATFTLFLIGACFSIALMRTRLRRG